MTKHCGHTIWWVISGGVVISALVLLLFPEIASAQATFRSIVDIPGISSDAAVTENFGLYINALYIFAITVGAMLAVLKLVAAGVKYMFSDIVTNKEAAKNDIKGALLGLLIVIGAVVILNTVNTDLANVDLNLEAANTDTNDYMALALARVQSLIDGCIGPECEVKDCEFWRTQLYCEDWCREQGPNTTYIHRGPMSAIGGEQMTHQCIVRYEGNALAERLCLAAGREWTNSTSSCRDVDDDREIITIRCIEDRTNPDPVDGSFQYDCTDARLECTGPTNQGEVLSASTAARIACAIPNQ